MRQGDERDRVGRRQPAAQLRAPDALALALERRRVGLGSRLGSGSLGSPRTGAGGTAAPRRRPCRRAPSPGRRLRSPRHGAAWPGPGSPLRRTGSSPAPSTEWRTRRVLRTSSSSRSNSENPLRSALVMTTPLWSGGPANAVADPPVRRRLGPATIGRTCPQVPAGTWPTIDPPSRRESGAVRSGHGRVPAEPGPAARQRRDPRDRHRDHQRRDPRHELGRAGPVAGGGRRGGRPPDRRARSPGSGRGRLPGRARPGRPRRVDRWPRSDARRPHPRVDRGDLGRDAGRRSRPSRPGCAACGTGGASRSPRSTSSRPG